MPAATDKGVAKDKDTEEKVGQNELKVMIKGAVSNGQIYNEKEKLMRCA
jgi:hypothetical protein